ncbi:unnamed protein product [Darwinula stevensoni]|uniref:RING-type domain-containing protein n=1 Tax=Darwinula stevensoni TaxID=69355 RepID=A0A7R8X3T7_9CRUS|nr:unnamed protein product [Darwinula stevensoni]CAG0878981.1 unnamed protein product [Darwinula stevensoni]
MEVSFLATAMNLFSDRSRLEDFARQVGQIRRKHDEPHGFILASGIERKLARKSGDELGNPMAATKKLRRSESEHKEDALAESTTEIQADECANHIEFKEKKFTGVLSLQCVICVNARATMETLPCGHRVVCRRCFVKTIQVAVSQRLLPLRCVICRTKVLRLTQQNQHSNSDYSCQCPNSASISSGLSSVSSCSWSSVGSSSSSMGKPKHGKKAPHSNPLQSSKRFSSRCHLSHVSSPRARFETLDDRVVMATFACTNPGRGVGRKGSSRSPSPRTTTTPTPTTPPPPATPTTKRTTKANIPDPGDGRSPDLENPPSAEFHNLPPIVQFQLEYRRGRAEAYRSTRIRERRDQNVKPLLSKFLSLAKVSLVLSLGIQMRGKPGISSGRKARKKPGTSPAEVGVNPIITCFITCIILIDYRSRQRQQQ